MRTVVLLLLLFSGLFSVY